MKNKISAIVTSLVLSLVVLVNSSDYVYATNQIDDSLEICDSYTRSTEVREIVRALINKSTTDVRKNMTLFTSEALDEILDYTQSINAIFPDGELSEVAVEYTTPINSSTGDSVIMANAKVWYNDYSYNMVYLFEFHVDANGDIYGFNIWTY